MTVRKSFCSYVEIEDIFGHSHHFALLVGLLLLYMNEFLLDHNYFQEQFYKKFNLKQSSVYQGLHFDT